MTFRSGSPSRLRKGCRAQKEIQSSDDITCLTRV